jgi:hypothetical protein
MRELIRWNERKSIYADEASSLACSAFVTSFPQSSSLLDTISGLKLVFGSYEPRSSSVLE